MSSIPYETVCYAPSPAQQQQKKQRASIGEVVGPGPKARQINRKLREKRRLTQFNFEVPLVDFREVVMSLGAPCAQNENQIQGDAEAEEAEKDAARPESDSGFADDDRDECDECDECDDDEIDADDIILKWVV